VYVHENIFFSFAIDANLEKLLKKFVDSTSKTWSSGTLQSSSNKASVPLHGESQVPKGGKIMVKVQKILMAQKPLMVFPLKLSWLRMSKPCILLQTRI